MNSLSKLLLAVGTGLAVGAVMGALYAPEKGDDTRRNLKRRGKKLAGLVNESIDDGKESLEEIKDVLQKQIQKVNKRIDEFKAV